MSERFRLFNSHCVLHIVVPDLRVFLAVLPMQPYLFFSFCTCLKLEDLCHSSYGYTTLNRAATFFILWLTDVGADLQISSRFGRKFYPDDCSIWIQSRKRSSGNTLVCFAVISGEKSRTSTNGQYIRTITVREWLGMSDYRSLN